MKKINEDALKPSTEFNALTGDAAGFARRNRHMRMDRLTTSLQNALAESQSLALGQDHNQVDTVHVLLALLEQTSSSVKDVVRRCGANVSELEKSLRQVLQDQPRVSSPDGNIQIAPELGRLLNLADKEAQKRGRSVCCQ